MRPHSRRLRIAGAFMLAVTGLGGCRGGPPPDALFRDAEALRVRYEKTSAEEALARFRTAASAWERQGDRRQAAKARQRVGMTHWQLGRLADALRAYEAALADARATGDGALVSEMMSDVGTARAYVAVRESDFDAAGQVCESSLALARESDAPPQEAKALTCLAEALYARGERERALDLYVQAGAMAERLGDRRGQADSLLNQGLVYSDQSDFLRAGERFAQAQQLWAALGDSRGTALTLLAVSKLHQRRGEFQDALNGLNEALVILTRMGDIVWEGTALTAFGSVHLQMGEPDHAIAYWDRALRRYVAAGLHSFTADLLVSLGEAYLALGDDARALEYFQRSLALATELNDDHWQAYALKSLGAVSLYRGDYGSAVADFERSLAVLARMRDPRFEAQTRASLAEACRRSGDLRRARTSYQAALSLSRSAGFRLGESQALDGLARVALTANDIEAARRYVEDAIGIVEFLRAGVSSGVLRASYVASVYRYYETQMDVLMRLDAAQPGRGFAAEAFEAGERARARALLESLAEAGVDLQKDVAPALAQRGQALEREFEAWATRQRQVMATAGDHDAERRLAAEYRDLEARHTALHAELRSRSPRYAALVLPRTLTLPQVQQSALDSDTVLLAYALGEQQSYLWAVWRTGYSVHRLPPRSRVEQAAQQVYGQLTARLGLHGSLDERRRQAEAADFLFGERARQLSDLLLEPVANAIAGKRLVIVADGALQYVPFAALPEPGGTADPVPLIVNHEIVSLPSASVIPVMRRLTSTRPVPPMNVAVLADPVFEPDDPRLRAVLRAAGRRPDGPPGGATRPPSARMPPARLAATRKEAEAILAAAGGGPSVAWLGFDASRAAATSAGLAQYRTVHFATHGIFDNESPGMSGIMLSMFDGQGRPQDGFLRLHDIYALRLPVELVVLSACNTALGRQVRGEGLVGMVRGFMHAGAKRVVASLWKVDDEATGDLMRRFYAAMLRDGRSPAAALRAAQLAVREQPRWKAPFYWAAFSLQGEWKASDGR